MANHSCINVVSDDNKYSSSIPLIGLYTATATLVCFLLMICDVLWGLRHRKPWLPCQLFSLNSLTLTLLAIATKLSTDLTTSMPSAQDQLSKLSGTTLICMSMGFLLPSLGTQSCHERLFNMASLTIFVLTVVVNVIIQMVTRVIFAFIVEHVIILSCMVLLLIALWDSTARLYVTSDICLDEVKVRLGKGNPQSSENECMIYRMKSFYLSSYENNPQLLLINSPPGMTLCMIPTLCTVLLSYATFKSLLLNKMEFHCGISYYRWSIWMVIVTQILTIVVCCIATGYRWFTVMNNIDFKEICGSIGGQDTPDLLYIDVASRFKRLKLLLNLKFGFGVFVLEIIVVTLFPAFLTLFAAYVMRVIKKCFGKQRNSEAIDLVREKQLYIKWNMGLVRWKQKKADDDIKWLVEKFKIDYQTHIFQFFCKTAPSQELLTNRLKFSSQDRVSCLSMVILVRMAIVSLPDTMSASLIHTLDEVFEIIYFIDKKMNVVTVHNKVKWMVAKYIWKHKKCIKPFVKKNSSEVIMRAMDGGFQSQFQLDLLDDALGIIEEIPLTQEKIKFVVRDDVHAINEFIVSCRPCTSINQLYHHIEQLFVDMLHIFLSQLPQAIFKHIVESPNEQCEERARLSLIFLCKLASLEDKVLWSFPIGTGITRLITPQGITRTEPLERDTTTQIALQIANDGETQDHA